MILSIAVVLTGCQDSKIADYVQKWAPGRTIDQLKECAGKPDSTDQLSNGLSIAQWNYTEQSTSVSAPILVGVFAGLVDAIMAPLTPLSLLAGIGNPSISTNTAGSCHAIVTIEDGIVIKLSYSGPNGDHFGKHSVCAPILRECLPVGYKPSN